MADHNIDEFGVHVHLQGQEIKDCYICNKVMHLHLPADHAQPKIEVLEISPKQRYHLHLMLHGR